MRKFLVAALLTVSATAVSAATINASATGTINIAHSHSALMGVDRFPGEGGGRGIAEFNLSTVNVGDTATFNFRVASFGGCCGGGAYTDPVTIYAYQGNGTYEQADFAIATFATLNSFATNGLSLGDTLSFDVTAALQQAVTNGYSFLGFKLIGVETGSQNGINFDQVNLETAAGEVPEPAMLGLFGLGAIGLGLSRRRRA